MCIYRKLKNDGVEEVQVTNESMKPTIVCDCQLSIECYPFLDKDQS